MYQVYACVWVLPEVDFLLVENSVRQTPRSPSGQAGRRGSSDCRGFDQMWTVRSKAWATASYMASP